MSGMHGFDQGSFQLVASNSYWFRSNFTELMKFVIAMDRKSRVVILFAVVLDILQFWTPATFHWNYSCLFFLLCFHIQMHVMQIACNLFALNFNCTINQKPLLRKF